MAERQSTSSMSSAVIAKFGPGADGRIRQEVAHRGVLDHVGQRVQVADRLLAGGRAHGMHHLLDVGAVGLQQCVRIPGVFDEGSGPAGRAGRRRR